MTGGTNTTDRRWSTDPRTGVATLALALAAAMASGDAVLTALMMGGLAGFSLSGSP